MDIKKHLIYWIAPSLVVLLCILIFYLNLFGLSTVVAPAFNREFGIVENIQNVLLVIIFLTAWKGFRNRRPGNGKYVCGLIMVITLFIFLEEIDYGLHYYDYLMGKREVTKVVVFDQEVRNIHNNGKLILNLMKLAAYVLVGVFFSLPLLPESIRRRSAVINFLSPSQYIVYTAASMVVLNQIARYLYKTHNYVNHALDANVSEFEEIMIYYIILLYLKELMNKPVDQWNTALQTPRLRTEQKRLS